MSSIEEFEYEFEQEVVECVFQLQATQVEITMKNIKELRGSEKKKFNKKSN